MQVPTQAVSQSASPPVRHFLSSDSQLVFRQSFCLQTTRIAFRQFNLSPDKSGCLQTNTCLQTTVLSSDKSICLKTNELVYRQIHLSPDKSGCLQTKHCLQTAHFVYRQPILSEDKPICLQTNTFVLTLQTELFACICPVAYPILSLPQLCTQYVREALRRIPIWVLWLAMHEQDAYSAINNASIGVKDMRYCTGYIRQLH